MKKLLFLLLLAMSATTYAQENDTLTILKPKKVRIITGDSIQKIKVYGKEGDDKYTYESSIQLVDSNYISSVDINKDSWNFDFVRKHSKNTGYPLERKGISTHLAFGLCQSVGANFSGSVSVGSSWEINWTIMELEKFGYGKRHGFSVGFGVDWRNFRMDGKNYFTKLDDGTITEQTFPAGYENDFSRIKVFSLNFPLMWRYRGNKVSFGLGPVININTYASIKTRYKKDGGKFKEMEKDIHQRKVTFDWMGIVYTPGPDFYIKYSPNDVLKEGSVKFRSLTFGLYL